MTSTSTSRIEVESQSNHNFDSYCRSRIVVESKSNCNCNSCLKCCLKWMIHSGMLGVRAMSWCKFVIIVCAQVKRKEWMRWPWRQSRTGTTKTRWSVTWHVSASLALKTRSDPRCEQRQLFQMSFTLYIFMIVCSRSLHLPIKLDFSLLWVHL